MLFSTIIGGVFGVVINILIQYFLSNFDKKRLEKTPKKLWQQCQKDRRYSLLIEAISIIFTVIILNKFGFSWQGIAALIFCYSVIILSFVDFKLQILPDAITKPLIAVGLVVGYLGIFTDFPNSMLGAFFGYFILWSINTVFRIVRKKEGMGYGDFKLLSAIGAWVGVNQLPLIMILSSFMGIIISVIAMVFLGKSLASKIPFGPSLALSGLVSLCYGAEMLDYYYSLVMP